MPDLKTFRQVWSSDHKRLRELLKTGADLDKARNLFFNQHSVLHSKKISGLDSWSYADMIFNGLSEDQFRIIPDNEDHSLIWILWHISRIEDVTMNILVGGGNQLYTRENWKNKLRSPVNHVGNLINSGDLRSLTESVDLDELFDYRNTVGKQTRSIVSDIEVSELFQKVRPDRLTQLVNEGAILPEAEELLSYWGKRKIFELLLMPPTRHLMTHLNEAYSLKKTLDR